MTVWWLSFESCLNWFPSFVIYSKPVPVEIIICWTQISKTELINLVIHLFLMLQHNTSILDSILCIMVLHSLWWSQVHKETVSQSVVEELDRSAQRPDLNPIQHLWGELLCRLWARLNRSASVLDLTSCTCGWTEAKPCSQVSCGKAVETTERAGQVDSDNHLW